MSAAARSARVELYRLLADEGRLRLLALAAEEALTVGELAELLTDSQPQVSRKASALRQAGLLDGRKEGTRTWLRAQPAALSDGVVSDALAEGRRLCHLDGSLQRVPEVVAAREEASHRFFAGDVDASDEEPAPSQTAASLYALAPLLPRRALAVDVGCGEGQLIDVLAPLCERVIAVDRSRARLARAARRIADNGFARVELLQASWDDVALLQRVDQLGGADVVFAGRVLHHAARPVAAVRSFARLLAPGGQLVVVDYLPHADESMRTEQADVWLGFSSQDLQGFFEEAGLVVTLPRPLPNAWRGDGPDAHLSWQTIMGRRPEVYAA